MKIYRMYDVKADIWHPPFPERNDETARRVFLTGIMDPRNPAYHHPSDFSLWCVGEFEENGPAVEPAKPEAMVATGLEMAAIREKMGEQE